MSATYYRPRWLAELTVPVAGISAQRRALDRTGDVVRFPVRVRKFTHERNDHNHADVLTIESEWLDTGIDPRLFKSAAVLFWCGQELDGETWRPTSENLRFAGVMRTPERDVSEESGTTVRLEFLDYTTLFTESKHFAPEGLPDFTQTLSQAWARICDWTGPRDPDDTTKVISTVSVLRDRIRFVGGARDVPIGDAVAPRFRKLAKVVSKPDTDAWAVWQQCVGMLGLISFIHLDEVIVTTATDYYSEQDPPKLIWGRNLLHLHEKSQVAFAAKGIGITSFDPLTGTTLEALWPPIGDVRLKHKKISAKTAQKSGGIVEAERQSEARDYFPYPGVTDEDALLEIAKRVYEERSRQEIEGTAVTREMETDTESGALSDLTQLDTGQVIKIVFDPEHLRFLQQLKSERERVNFLVRRGYSIGVATVLARNLRDLSALESKFFTRRVVTSGETTPDGGSFDIDITFVNRIQIDGAARARDDDADFESDLRAQPGPIQDAYADLLNS